MYHVRLFRTLIGSGCNLYLEHHAYGNKCFCFAKDKPWESLFLFVLGGLSSGLVTYKEYILGNPMHIICVGVSTVRKFSNSSAER